MVKLHFTSRHEAVKVMQHIFMGWYVQYLIGTHQNKEPVQTILERLPHYFNDAWAYWERNKTLDGGVSDLTCTFALEYKVTWDDMEPTRLKAVRPDLVETKELLKALGRGDYAW